VHKAEVGFVDYLLPAADGTALAIATASRIGPRVFFVWARMLLRKIFEVPNPSRKRPGPAASWTTRASIAT
jgi:hypothetical protein